MSQNQNPSGGGIAPITGTEAKTPLERAKQIQEMQRQMDAQPVTPQAPVAPTNEAQSAVSVSLQKAVEVWDAKPVNQVDKLKGPDNHGADQAVYGAHQSSELGLFVVGGKNTDIEVTGTPWKIIPFGPAQSGAVLDLKKPAEGYNFTVPPNAVKHKEGKLFNLTATPKAGTDAAVKRAVLADDKGGIKGVELKGKEHLERMLGEVPTFMSNLFQSVFGDGVLKDMPKTHHRIESIETGKKSAYEVKIGRKNELDGKWKSETVTLNNFGLKVPPSNDARRHDINVAMYYLDRFQAG